jgi:hypothetical protein
MKHELIKTEDYLLVISDEEINEGDWWKSPYGVYSQFNGDEKLIDGTLKIIAHLPLNNSPILEGVDLLPPLPQGEDVEELAKESVPDGFRTIWKNGYNKAKETYKYTEEEVRELLLMQRGNCYVAILNKTHDKELASLASSAPEPRGKDGWVKQQPKLPIAFETTCDCQECGANKTNLSLDMGCENKIATITNSQGQTEWVGKYIF